MPWVSAWLKQLVSSDNHVTPSGPQLLGWPFLSSSLLRHRTYYLVVTANLKAKMKELSHEQEQFDSSSRLGEGQFYK